MKNKFFPYQNLFLLLLLSLISVTYFIIQIPAVERETYNKLVGIAGIMIGMYYFLRQQKQLQQLSFVAENAKSDQILQQFYELPFIGMSIASPETKRRIKFNDRLCEILGYSIEELSNISWTDITYPDDTDFNLKIHGNSVHYTHL